MSNLAARHGGGDLQQATFWINLPEDERKRRAAAAARDRDADTLWGLTRAYMVSRRRYSELSLFAYEGGVRRLVDTWEGVNLLRPGPDDGRLYRMHLEENGLSERERERRGVAEGEKVGLSTASVVQALAAGRKFYAALRWAGVTTAVPFDDVTAGPDPVAPEDKRDPYELDDLAKLYAAATDPAMKVEPTTPLMLLLGAHSGLRVGEMLGVSWGDIKLRRKELVVRKGKGNKQRTVPLSSDTVALLNGGGLEPGAADDLVFGGVTAHALRDRMRRLCKRAGVDYLGIHSLRHTAGTTYNRMGMLRDVQKILGHASSTTSERYAKWDKGRMHELADGLMSVRSER
ncbi:MAG: tyrosine-type recombinase/integrase [Trueperaceae bacterium]|nr:tyrosine-type recombinase/integrase [Trueperaceae bacterium]